jgi:hypothetical protein
MPLSEIEDEVGCSPSKSGKAFTAFLSEHANEFIGIILEARNDLPTIAS